MALAAHLLDSGEPRATMPAAAANTTMPIRVRATAVPVRWARRLNTEWSDIDVASEARPMSTRRHQGNPIETAMPAPTIAVQPACMRLVDVTRAIASETSVPVGAFWR